MTSLSGNKERSRNRKHAMMDCSPTKAASVSPDSWYSKACEESRSGFRPVPEGARSVPGSSGAPSPGSGTSSPGSFSSSPGTVSPGIGTSSPGSLGGSPGFGTGSPASGSGSSPGSERGTWCDTCTGHLVELKRHAAKLLLPGPYSFKDLSISPLLQEKLHIPSSPRKAWNEQESRCEVCFTHLSQLKQEAVRLVLTCDVSPGSPPTLLSLVGTKNFIQGSTPHHLTGSHYPVSPSSSTSAASTSSASLSCSTTCSISNVSISSPQHTKHGTKPNTTGVERKSSSLSHTHPESNWSPTHLSCSNGVTLLPYEISDSNKECMSDAANSCNTDRPVLPPASSTTAPSTGASAAASFFARAAQKLNLSSKKKKQKLMPTAPMAPPLFPSNFSGILQLTPPPAPPCLLRAVGKVRDNPGLGKVKVMLRVCAVSHAESSSFLKVDSRKKQVSIMDPAANSQHNTSQKRGAATQAPPRIFTFDSAFSHDSSQAEVCAGTVAEVIQSVVNGADGCVFCFGHAKLGKTYTMIGKDDSMQNLGIIPCAISWLFKIITERKEKTGARFSVRVSAVEVWGRGENLRDLLADVATGNLQGSQAPGVYLCEDPICGMQLKNQSELRAATAENAAFFLDAALAARYSSRAECDEDEHHNSHMLFTLHVYQYRMEKSGKGGMSGGRSRLHLIDLGSCVKQLAKPCESATPSPCLSLSALGNVILALVNGSKHIPYKDSKLAMLLRESLGNINCRTTMIAHISSSPSHFSETISTLQIASRVLRMKKKKTKQYTSSSSGGESSCEEGKMRRPTQLRNIHSRNVRDSEIPLLHISSEPDDYSSSEQSCDTVIYVGPNGSVLSDKELTDNEGPPEFVPIVPSILKGQQGRLAPLPQMGDSLILPPQGVQTIPTLHPHTLPPVPEETVESNKQEKDCLKCNTFAELQERLGCIDGSEDVNTFLFEEVPASRLKKLEPLTSCTNTNSSQSISNDQQLEEIREVVEEAEIAQSIIESLTKSTINSCTTSGCGGTGVRQLTALQRANSLQDSRESISGASSSDSKPRSMGSPRLGIASLTKTTEYKPPSSPSQRSKVYTQKGVMPNTPPQCTHNLYGDSGKSSMESLLQAEFRTSPVGMVLMRSSSSKSLGSVDTLCDDVPQLPLDSKNITSDTLQQLLEPQEEEGLISSLVKERKVKGIMEDSGPNSLIRFNSDCSVQAPASGSQPISSMSGDLECYSNSVSIITSTISEAKIAEFQPFGKDKSEFTMSPQSSNSSSPTKEELIEQIKEDGNVFCASETSTKMFSTTEKTAVTVSSVQSFCNLRSFLPNKTSTTSQTSVALINNDSPNKVPLFKDSRSSPVPFSNNMTFKDPWMKMGSFSPDELELKVEKGTSELIKSRRGLDRNSSSSCEADDSPDSFKRVIDGCEMVLNVSESINPVFPANILRTGSLPRAWHRLNKQDEIFESSNHCMSGDSKTFRVTTSTPCSPRATLERRGSSGRQGFFTRPKGIPPLPPVRKSSLDQRNKASPQHNSTSNQGLNLHLSFLGNTPEDQGVNGKQTGAHFESTRLFSAKLELLANRTNSLERSHVTYYDCHSLERRERLMPVGSKAAIVVDGTMPRFGRSATRNSIASLTNGPNFNSNVSHSSKSSQSKISAVTKLLMASPKSRSLSTSGTKTLSFSTKSLPQSVNRSSSLPPNGKNLNQNSWSTQSLSRNKGSGLASKLPLRAVNGRISELLQGIAGQAGPGQGRSSAEEKGGSVQGAEKPAVHTLPSPYSKITAPRKPHRCSSGHASDNSSVLSGELPPAMGKTALFYHSGGSSGYESMIRDSEATGSASSTQESMSDTSSSVSGRSLKNPKKRNNTGSQRRRIIPSLTLDPTSPVRKPILSPGVRWVDGPRHSPQRGVAEPFEIKVYEIDNVERLQRKRTAVSKGVARFSAKLKILEHRQQRIFEIRTKYEWLKKELEQTKQHLMLEPEQWSAEFDVEPVFEVDSLEYLEALEFVTQRLETRVNFCKAHLMMVTCFDVTCRRR